MRTRVVAGSLSVVLSISAAWAQTPLGTAFTYQGQLTNSGSPANGSFNMDFKLYPVPTGGTLLASQTLAGVVVTNGLFTVQVDFGAGVFDGNKRWLDVTVNGTPLVPRQELTVTPYALQTRGIFVDSLGKVGIGTTTPFARLAVEGGGLSVFDGVGQGVVLTSNDIQFANATNEDPVYHYKFSPEMHEFFVGGGAALTLNAAGVTAGTFFGSGSGLTDVDAVTFDNMPSSAFGQITHANAWTGGNTFSNAANTFTGSGTGLTSLNAANISSGTLPDTRLSSNVTLLNNTQTLIGAKTLTNAANSFTGSGAGLTSLNAANISSGTLADARLSANIPRLNVANTFTANIGLGGASNANRLHVVGDADVTGNLAAGTVTIAATQREYIVGALDFLNGLTAIPDLNNPYLEELATAKSYFAPVHLPQGATVASISSWVEDHDGGGDVTIFLIRRDESNGNAGGTMAQFSSVGTGGQRITDSTITGAVIDNTNFAYFVRIDMPGGGVNISQVASVHITYTVSEPLP